METRTKTSIGRIASVCTLALALLVAGGCKRDAAGSSGGAAPASSAPAATAPTTPAASGPWTSKVEAGTELYASLETSLGTVVVKLYSREAPQTVKNFVGLATGEKEWRNPATGQTLHTPLYAGTVFHRVIDGFMIQGGDPLGNGRGDPGYRFADEPNGRVFDRTGLLAMANAGPNTNGSQFFITVSTPTYLNGRHTIFGEVVKGYDVVTAISKVPRDPMDRPVEKVELKTITLSESSP